MLRSGDDLVAALMRLVRKVIEYEREMRRVLLRDQRTRIEDRVSRCLGILRSARVLTVEEALTHLSGLRLGLALNLIEEPLSAAALNELYVLIQPAHLEQLAPTAQTTDPDSQRASFLRTRLQENPLHP